MKQRARDNLSRPASSLIEPRFFAALLMAFFTSAAWGDAGLSERLKQWELVGRWSNDCSPDAEPHGTVYYEIQADGEAVIDNGQSLTNLRIERVDPDGHLTLRTIEPSGEGERVLTLRKSGDTLRPISGKEPNDYTQQGGKFVASLKETTPLRRCN